MRIVFTKNAEKELLSLEKPNRLRIFRKIGLLSESPFPAGSRKLEAGTGYRIRIGAYRVVYTILKEELVILVLRIAHRKEVYK